MEMKKKLSIEQTADLFNILKFRFEKNVNRHEGLSWIKGEERLHASAEKKWFLNEMD